MTHDSRSRHERASVRVVPASASNQHSIAPGKRTRTMSLQSSSNSGPSAMVQRKARADGGLAQTRSTGPAEDWTHAVFRPDLYQAPILRKSMSDVGRLDQDSTGAGDGNVAQTAADGVASPAQPMPHLDRIAPLFGSHDLSSIRAHVGGAASDACNALGSEAYATGSDVAFRSTPSLHTAAHEAAHVIQQRAGVSLEGGIGQEEDAYERHADAVADRVVRGESAVALLDAVGSSGAPRGGSAVQKQTNPPPGRKRGRSSTSGHASSAAAGGFAAAGAVVGAAAAPTATFSGSVDRVEWAGGHGLTAYGGDMRTNPVWTPGTTDHAVAFSVGSTPNLNVRIALTSPAPTPLISADLRGKIGSTVVAQGSANVNGNTIEANLATTSLPNAGQFGQAVYTIQWEASTGGSWSPLGSSGGHLLYWLASAPIGTLYSLAAAKITGYAAAGGAPAAAIRQGIHGEIPYDPSDGNIEANPLDMYGGGGHVCADFANLMAFLARSAGLAASPRIYFGGINVAGKMLWVRDAGVSLVSVNPGAHDFTYHAITDVSGTIHDAALNRTGIDAQAAHAGLNLRLADLSSAAVPNGKVGTAYTASINRVVQTVDVVYRSFGGLLSSASFGNVVPLDLPHGTSGTVDVNGAWSITAGALPAGVTLNPATGELSGTPTAAGTSTFTVQIDLGAGITGSAALILTVAP